MKMSKYMVVASVDALVFEDLEYAKTLPNFARILSEGSIVERVLTVYPSDTHPVHASIMTGAPTGATGITNNLIFRPASPVGGPFTWYNDLDQLKCETIFHAAKRAGLTTAACTWPMTSGGGEVIDYLVPNALNGDFEGYEDRPLDVYRRLGAQECIMDIIEEGVRRHGWQNRHPEFDDFQTYCAAEIIKRYKPNLLLTHPGYVDSMRHRSGVFGELVKPSIEATDRWFGILLDAIREAGIEDETDFVFLSDHGQINITRVISPNVYLADAGYIKLDGNGNLLSWDAYTDSAGASAHVYLARPDDKALYDGVYKLLCDMAEEGIYGISKVYTTAEAREKYGLYGDFSFVIEGDGYTSFGEYLVRPAVRGFDFNDYRYCKGTHGHAPDRGPQPPFVCAGPSFKKGVVVPTGKVINHAPTLARALGIELPQAEGEPVLEILK